MARSSPTSADLRTACVCLFVTLAVSACHDADDDPTALLVAEETRAALLVDERLPSFPELVGEAAAEGSLSRAMDLWLESWSETGPEASRLREVAYHDGSSILARTLGRDAVVAAHGQLGDVLVATARLSEETLPADLEGRLGTAADLHASAARLLDEDRDAEALIHVMRGSDALRTVGPRGVAEMLIGRADRRLELVRETADEVDVARADRLLRGARTAIENEDWSRAVRRAYYACQVLGVSPR